MLRTSVFLLVPLLFLGACRTNSKSSDKTFEIAGDAAAANRLIVETVIKTFPDIAAQQAVVSKFAQALQNDDKAGVESPEALLKFYYAKRDSEPSSETAFDRYVIREFLALTNYLEFRRIPGTVFAYLGNTTN